MVSGADTFLIFKDILFDGIKLCSRRMGCVSPILRISEGTPLSAGRRELPVPLVEGITTALPLREDWTAH